MKRPLTEAELAQRQKAGPNGGRPRRSAGERLNRLAVERARKILKSNQVMAAKNLVAGMKGQLPAETAEQIIACSREVLTRGGIPPLLRTENKNQVEGAITFLMEDSGSKDADPSHPEDPPQRP